MTHAIDYLHLFDEVFVLNKGKIVLRGHYEDIKNSEYLAELECIRESQLESKGDSSERVKEVVSNPDSFDVSREEVDGKIIDNEQDEKI